MKKAQLLNPELLDPEKYDENKIKECAEILLEADEIRKDEVLMKKIKEHLDQKKKKISSLAELKEIASNYSNKEDDEE